MIIIDENTTNKAVELLNLFKIYLKHMTIVYICLMVLNIVFVITSACVNYTKHHLAIFLVTFFILGVNLLLYLAMYFRFKGFNKIADPEYYKETIHESKCYVILFVILDFLWSLTTFVLFLVFVTDKIDDVEQQFFIIEVILISVTLFCGFIYGVKTYYKLHDNLEVTTEIYNPSNIVV